MILDSKTDRVSQGARGSDWCESILIDFIAQHDLVDRYCLDHPEREMWTWIESLPSVHARSYLDRVLARRADTEFVSFPCFTG